MQGEEPLRYLSPHSNFATSTRRQHTYNIVDTHTINPPTGQPDIIETGISGQPMNQNGTSPRANTQMNALDGGPTGPNSRYQPVILNQDIPDRQAVLAQELANAPAADANGNSLRIHTRPTP